MLMPPLDLDSPPCDPSIASASRAEQAASYELVAATLGAALERLARSYEFDSARRQDLLQDIHLAIWRSLGTFDGRCSLRTWVYRVAHNVGVSHAMREQRHSRQTWVGLDAAADEALAVGADEHLDRADLVERMYALLDRLQPLDRQVMTLYLEDLEAAAIGEVTGLSAGNVATKISRIKRVLGKWAREREE